MKGLFTSIRVLFFLIFTVNIASGMLIGHIGISNIEVVSWDCADANYNLPPYASEYSGGVCGYSIDKLVNIPYFYRCDASNNESYYWLRAWDHSPTSMVERCYDHEGGDTRVNCDGEWNVIFNPEADVARYLQIDLYSQCTGCTGPSGLSITDGSWLSSNGNTGTPSANQGFGMFSSVLINEYRKVLGDRPCDALCFDLNYIGAPSCTCIEGSNYGCGPDDQN